MQTGAEVSGTYRDRHDQGFASGTVTSAGHVVIDVRFGDMGIRFEGDFNWPNCIRGTISGSAIWTHVLEMTH